MDTILHYIQKYAQTQPDTMAVCELRKSVTYKEYWSSIRKTPGVLEIGGRVDSECLISDKEADGISSIKIKDIIARAKDADEADLELPGENDRSMLLFTTGTTGSSKGVVMLHRGDVGIAGNVIEGTSMKKGNVEIIPMPLNHSF